MHDDTFLPTFFLNRMQFLGAFAAVPAVAKLPTARAQTPTGDISVEDVEKTHQALFDL